MMIRITPFLLTALMLTSLYAEASGIHDELFQQGYAGSDIKHVFYSYKQGEEIPIDENLESGLAPGGAYESIRI